MMKLRKRIVFTGLVIIIIIFWVKNYIMYKDSVHLVSTNVFELPDLSIFGGKFTCTGICYDKKEECFYIGYAGKSELSDDLFKAAVVKMNRDLTEILDVIHCYRNFPLMKDIQGVVADESNDSLWICSYGENIVRNISKSGVSLKAFDITKPSGIAYDEQTDTLWILTNNSLTNVDKNGHTLKCYDVSIPGQDQLYYDEDNRKMYFTVGRNYNKPNYVYTFLIEEQKLKREYILDDSYAVEGIYIDESDMIILNDGYYHEAKVPTNQVNHYTIRQE